MCDEPNVPNSSGSVAGESGRDNWTGKDLAVRPLRRWCNNCRWFAPVARDCASAPWPLRLTCREIDYITNWVERMRKGLTWRWERSRQTCSGNVRAGKFGSRVGTVCRIRSGLDTIETRLLRSSPETDCEVEEEQRSACVWRPRPGASAPVLPVADAAGGPFPVDWTTKASGRRGRRSATDRWWDGTSRTSTNSLDFAGRRPWWRAMR